LLIWLVSLLWTEERIGMGMGKWLDMVPWDVGKDGVVDGDGDGDEEGRRTPMVVVAQQHCGDDHQKEVIPTNTCYEEEGIAVAALSDDRRIFFLFRGHNSLMECMIGF